MKYSHPALGALACFSTVHAFQPSSHPARFSPQQNTYVQRRSKIVVRSFSSDDQSTTSDEPSTTGEMETTFATKYHAPVMWRECIDSMLGCQRSIREDGEPLIFVDGTLGGGGHSAALLERLQPGDIVFGCDVDQEALDTASQRLAAYMTEDTSQHALFVPVQSNFCDLAIKLQTVVHPHTQQLILDKNQGVDGILLDLGVSSHQIDTAERGFAFMKDGPLDMRMGTNLGLTAADICNEFDEKELQRIFSKYGDEPRAKTVAKSVCNQRPLTTTGELVSAIASVTPQFHKSKRMGRTATCARVFQSLRIVVNNEDKVLNKALTEMCPSLIRPGGRLVVLSYHSMEDRATKRIMRDGTLGKVKDERDMYGNYCGIPKPFAPVVKRQQATQEEVESNPRARSATLRVAERSES
jgi:16S rRNA (cytosine1402-N4)-methyltransferase